MTDQAFLWVVRAIVMVTALPIHEFSHALVASKLGDDTARHKGRLTLNPFAHLDPLGSLLLIFAGFGWAKPVPINPRNLKHPRRDMALSALAGPVSNLLMAILLLCIYKVVFYNALLTPSLRYHSWLYTFLNILSTMVYVNISLCIFNFLPIPPLDGSKIFGAFMSDELYFKMMQYDRYIMIVLMLCLVWGVLDKPLYFLIEHGMDFIMFITSPIDMIFT